MHNGISFVPCSFDLEQDRWTLISPMRSKRLAVGVAVVNRLVRICVLHVDCEKLVITDRMTLLLSLIKALRDRRIWRRESIEFNWMLSSREQWVDGHAIDEVFTIWRWRCCAESIHLRGWRIRWLAAIIVSGTLRYGSTDMGDSDFDENISECFVCQCYWWKAVRYGELSDTRWISERNSCAYMHFLLAGWIWWNTFSSERWGLRSDEGCMGGRSAIDIRSIWPGVGRHLSAFDARKLHSGLFIESSEEPRVWW